jgi:hypothetical protein
MSQQDNLASTDKRILARRVRNEGKQFEDDVIGANRKLPDLGNRVAHREPEDLESFQREIQNEKKLREQRIAKQMRAGAERPLPQSQPLPGDTRD